MKAVVQRVSHADVVVDGRTVGAIDRGLLVLVGVLVADEVPDALALARKIAGLRIFRDEAGKMNRSIGDVDGSILVVSQFTLAGEVRKGRRPSFVSAAAPIDAEPLVEIVCQEFAATGIPVERGIFGADMTVSLVNDGPITLIVETHEGTVS